MNVKIANLIKESNTVTGVYKQRSIQFGAKLILLQSEGIAMNYREAMNKLIII